MARASPPPLSAFEHVLDDTVRLSDLDFQQHVNNAALTTLLANGRYDFLARVRERMAPGHKLVLARIEVDFLGEVRYGRGVRTATRLLSFGRTSLRLEQVLCQDGRCAAHATGVLVHFSPGGGAVPWPGGLADAFPLSPTTSGDTT